MNDLISAKALNDEDNSEAVLVSFSAEWHDVIFKKEIKAIVRKRVPKNKKCNLIYIYLNAPLSQLIGRARIISVGFYSIRDVIKFQNDLKLSKEEISSYSGELDEIGLYKIDKIEIFKNPIKLDLLKTNMRFSPPQSFLFLSKCAKELIDKYAER